MSTTRENVTEAIAMAGLLFQPHPQCGGWRTTRALAPEVVAFHNKQADPPFDRLAIEFHEGGLPDENGYVPANDEYRVVAHDRGPYGDQPAEGVYDTAAEAADAVVELMETVVAARE